MRPGIVRWHKSGDQLDEREARQAAELESVDNAIERILTSLKKEEIKPSVADLARLLEIRRGMTVSQPRPVTVRWIDSWPQEPTEK
jgi:hypothetical protein